MNSCILSIKASDQYPQVKHIYPLFVLIFATIQSVIATFLNPIKYNNLKPARLTNAFCMSGSSGYGCGDNINDYKNVNRCNTRGRNPCGNRPWKPS